MIIRQGGCTGQTVVTPPLHVESGQIQRDVLHKLEQPLSQSIHHHVILCVQLSWTADQTPQQRVNPTCRGGESISVIVQELVT